MIIRVKQIKAIVLMSLLATAIACQRESVVVLYSNNANGHIDPCECEDERTGGLSRRKTLFDQWRAKTPLNLTLDAGDVISALPTRPEQDKFVISLYRQLGYDAINLGDQEFIHGSNFAQAEIIGSGLPFLSSSLTPHDTALQPPGYFVFEKATLKIGVLGFAPVESFGADMRDSLALGWARFAEKFDSNLTQLRARHSPDLIILLSQAGDEGDVILAAQYPELDIIIGSHSQALLEEPLRSGNALIVQAGGDGNYIGRLEITTTGGEIVEVNHQLILVGENVEPDSAIDRQIEEFRQRQN